jgi:ribosomal-protein-serine acetyltransferase
VAFSFRLPGVSNTSESRPFPSVPARLSLADEAHLRPLEEADAAELYALVDADRAYLARWLPWAAGQSAADTLEFIRGTRRQMADDNGFQAAIVRDGAIAGAVGFHAVDWANRSTSIGYWLGERHQRRGTMTAAVRALVEHAVSVWQLNRVEIRAAPGNARSRAIPERLGFREEGTLRQAERIGEHYLDNVVYSVLASEWGAS